MTLTRARGIALVSTLLGLVLLGWALLLPHWYGLDVQVYQYGAYTVRTAPGTLYDPVEGRPRNVEWPFTYPPFAALLFLPLSYLDGRDTGFVVMTVVSLVCLMRMTPSLRDHLRRELPARLVSWAPALTPALVFAMLVMFGPDRATLGFGQVNIVLMAAVYLTLQRTGLGFLTGVAIGLCGGIKLTPLALGLLPLARRRWDCLAGIVTGFLGSVALGYLVLPTDSNRFWLHAVHDPSRVGRVEYLDNMSFRGLLARHGMDNGLLWLLGCIAVAGITLWYLARCGSHLSDVEALGLACVPMLFASPVTWSHHWVWGPVTMLGIIAPARSLRGPWRTVLLAAWTVALLYLLLTPKGILHWGDVDTSEKLDIPYALSFLSDIPAVATLVLVSVMVVAARRAPRGPVTWREWLRPDRAHVEG